MKTYKIGTDDPCISIVIVTWNSIAHLPRCLSSLRAQTFKDFEVIVIDNGSIDGSIDLFESQYFDFNKKVLKLGNNSGFAVANNIGARLARGKWLVLLNTDAFPESNWLENLIKATKDNPEYSCFSSRQLQANNPEFLDGAGDAYHVSGMAWRIGLGYPAGRYGIETAEIFSPCAAAALYLRKAFLEVGGFDEEFFSYYEDVDLGFRLQLRGYRSLYVPTAVVRHIGSATFGERSDFAFYHSHRNLIWTFVKNMPLKMIWRHILAHLLANLIYLGYYSLKGRGKVLVRAKLDALRGLSRTIRKRQDIQKDVRITVPELEQRMHHGWLQPYLLGYQLRKTLRNDIP